MYLSSDEARSDLFLSAAVYVVGPMIFGFVFRVTRLLTLPVVSEVLQLAVAVATTVLVPYLLIRYRKQRLSEFGFGAGRATPMLNGLLAVAPVVVVGYASEWLMTGSAVAASPLLTAIAGGTEAGLDGMLGVRFLVVLRFIDLVGRALLAVYCTVLAREAFRGDPAYLRTTAQHLGRIIGIGLAAATLLLLANFVTGTFDIGGLLTLLLQPVGVAAAVVIAIWRAKVSRLTMRPVLITPAVIFPIGTIALGVVRNSPVQLVTSIWQALLLAGIGLVIGLLVESDRSVWGPVVIGVALALLAYLPVLPLPA